MSGRCALMHRMEINESALLLDETLIEREHGIERAVQPGEKMPFVMEPDLDKPWEFSGPGKSKRIYLYGTVLYDELMGKYRMWYFCRMGPHWRFAGGTYQIPGLYIPRTDEKPYHCDGLRADSYGREFADNDRGDLTCYAESDDGIHWSKPDLGIFTFNGRLDNNIVWDLHGASVFIDREESDPQKRYKAIGFCRRYRNIFLITSPDGIHWDDKDHIEPVSRRANEGTFNVVYDDKQDLYRAYSLTRLSDRDHRRIICYSESRTLAGPWKDAEPIFEPTHWDDEIGRRKYGALRAELHNMSAFRYNNIYLGLAGVLYVTAEQIPGEQNQMPCDGPIDAQFVYSRDGLHWSHADRERTPAIPRGGTDSFDCGMIIGTAKEPVIAGDEVHWYYSGAENTHGGRLEERVKRIGRATWQRDRFVALQARGDGLIETKPLLPIGVDRLELNADATGGQLRVELCDAQGEVIKGFAREECLPLAGDEIRWPVQWKNADFSSLSTAVRIRLIANRAKVYSFSFAD